jgi:hypothetical protein
MLTDGIIRPIVKKTVAKDKVHVIDKGLRIFIAVVTKLLFYGSEIHWIIDLRQVIRNVKFYRIYWLLKEECPLSPPAFTHYPQCKLLPTFLLLRPHAIQLSLFNRVRIAYYLL